MRYGETVATPTPTTAKSIPSTAIPSSAFMIMAIEFPEQKISPVYF
jgi:hypothetical protein